MKTEKRNHFSPRWRGYYLEERPFVSPDPAVICDKRAKSRRQQKRENNDDRIPLPNQYAPIVFANCQLLVRRQRLHSLWIHRNLYFIAMRRSHESHAHARECIHEGHVAETPDSKKSSSNAQLPETERNRSRSVIKRRINLEIPVEPETEHCKERDCNPDFAFALNL